MSTQRKFNYSFRSRNLRKVPDNRTDIGEQQKDSSHISVNEEIPKNSPSFPSDCDNEDLVSQKLPPPDQPITAAELEQRKNTIRGEYHTFHISFLI